MRISKYFTKKEIACKCGCGFDTIDPEVLAIADDVREFEGHPITPNCGCRCPKHNKEVGGAPKSYHVRGMAMDMPTSNPERLYNYLNEKYKGRYGFGLYNTFVHIDCRHGIPWREDKRK